MVNSCLLSTTILIFQHHNITPTSDQQSTSQHASSFTFAPSEMCSMYLRNRVRLATAIASYLRTRHHESGINTNANELVKLMRPRSFKQESGIPDSIGMINDHILDNWDASETPFYMMVDFHVAITNLVIDGAMVDVDVDEMLPAVTGLYYSGDNQDAEAVTNEFTIKNDLVMANAIDIVAGVAAAHYRILEMDHLKNPMEKVELLKSTYGLDSAPKPADKTECLDGDQVKNENNENKDNCNGDNRVADDKITAKTAKTEVPSGYLRNTSAMAIAAMETGKK